MENINRMGHAMLVAAPILVRARGSSRMRSCMTIPHNRTRTGMPRPVSKLASPTKASFKIGHANHTAPLKQKRAQMVLKRSILWMRSKRSALIASSTSPQSMICPEKVLMKKPPTLCILFGNNVQGCGWMVDGEGGFL